MSSTYFQFKQFAVNQDITAMKIGTDGVLLGAWANTLTPETVLDIGTGTGLIAIMLAQRFCAKINAVEIEQNAYKQARQNIENCKWSKQINIQHISFQDYWQSTSLMFDLIVCNPPFFENSLKTPNAERTLARHNDSLPMHTLFTGVEKLLQDKGHCCIIIPYLNHEKVISIAEENNLFLNHKTIVKPNLQKEPKRTLLKFGHQKQIPTITTLTIEKQRHIYTEEYKKLTNEFYLN